MWNPLKLFQKSYDQVSQPELNKFLKSIFQYTTHNGLANVMKDDPTAYLEQGYAGSSDVYAIINRIIRMSGQARLALYKMEGGKWKEQTDHELTRFTRAVNPTMKTADFVQGHLIYKLSIGNSYWYKPTLTAGVNKGKTTELWLLPGNNVEIVGGASWMNPVGGYVLQYNVPVKFEPQEVYHSKYFNPLFGIDGTLYGQSPLKAAAMTVSKQNEAESTELKQYENQSPPYILYRDTDNLMNGLTVDQRKQLEDVFKKHASGGKRGSGLVLPEKFGMLKIGVSPVDLGILESSIEGRRKLCNIYGFPAELMNDKAASTYSNVADARKAAWTDCIIPNLNELATDLTSFLIDPVPEYAGLFFAYDYSEVQELQADMQKKVQWMRQSYLTPNEIREMVGYNAVKDPALDEVWVGMGEMPLSQAVSDITVEPLLKNYDYGKRDHI